MVRRIFTPKMINYAAIVFVMAMATFSNAAFGREKECPLNGAEYVPQNQKIASYDPKENLVNRSLSFVLRIEEIPSCRSSMRCRFLNFDAYDKNGKIVSSIRFGNVFSNGLSKEGFSTIYGQYEEARENADFKPSAGFHVVGVNKDLTSADITNTPPLLIFPGTLQELTYNSYQQPQNWDHYIRFYTPERVYPDFRMYDFWVLNKCGKKVK